MTVSVVLAVYRRDRQRSIARFHEALGQLQGSPLLPQAGVSVTAAEDTAGSELMAVATAAVAAVATVELHLQQRADGGSWQTFKSIPSGLPPNEGHLSTRWVNE
ncbi:hypothetical protein ABBQ32_003898 [Trebouxia sp. C0010 RCD-2024]